MARITLSHKYKYPRLIIKGTNISVIRLFEMLTQGADLQTLFKEYPTLTKEDLEACFAYAQDLLEREEWPCDDVLRTAQVPSSGATPDFCLRSSHALPAGLGTETHARRPIPQGRSRRAHHRRAGRNRSPPMAGSP